MAGSEEGADKSHEPTPKKLEDARKKGEIARSTDVNVAMAYMGAMVFFAGLGAQQLSDFGLHLQGMLVQASLGGDARNAVGFGAALSGASAFAPLFALPAGLILAALFAQRALLFTPSKLKPKLTRLSVIKNAQNKFGRGGLFEFSKSLAKLIIYSICLTVFLARHMPQIISSAQLEAKGGLALFGSLFTSFLSLVVVIALALAAVDLLWQRQEHRRKNMMTHKEMRDESKEAEGDPHFKGARRAKAQEIATSHMIADVAEADVVIVNPTHYAVALKWAGTRETAPVCVAKGVDEIAARIREAAQAADVPLHSDPPTARALYASLNIGHEIEPDHYAAVAIAIRFAETAQRKKRRLG